MKTRSIRDFVKRDAEVRVTPAERCRESDTAFLFDPRSPTQEISRTPIALEDTSNINIMNQACLSETAAEGANARFDDSGEVLKAAKKTFGT